MARTERAHPDHPGYKKGQPAYKRFVRRHKWCLPFVEGKIVLDVPCGIGWGTSILGGAAKEIHGLDIDGEAIKYGREHYKGLQLQAGDMQDLPYMGDYFDVVISLAGFEHIERSAQEQFMKEVVRTLKAGGHFVLMVPLSGYSKGKNPFHLHEPTMEEVSADLSSFETVSMKESKGVLWYVGRLLQ